MKREELTYTPSEEVLHRSRFFLLRTGWHASLIEAMLQEAQTQFGLFRFPLERVHILTVPGAFELVHLAAQVARYYSWKQGFAQAVGVRGPTFIQSNLKLPPFFQGNFESHLRSEFFLESPGPIKYPQPYEPPSDGELPVIIALGCILKGETEHNRYLAHAVIHHLARISADSGVPVVLGVLTPDTEKQAWERVAQARDWVKAGFWLWESRMLLARVLT